MMPNEAQGRTLDHGVCSWTMPNDRHEGIKTTEDLFHHRAFTFDSGTLESSISFHQTIYAIPWCLVPWFSWTHTALFWDSKRKV
jgi:hypothetical protein